MSSLKDLYTSGGKEISLRGEFNALETGSSVEIPKLRHGLFRLMRKDAQGKKIACECVDKLTGEPDKEFMCPVCMGEGFKWDEVRALFHRVADPKEVIKPAGLINVPIVTFYAKFDARVTEDDKIVELVLDSEGNIVTPAKRHGIYKVQHAEPLRLDNGRVEYLKIWTYKEDVRRLNK